MAGRYAITSPPAAMRARFGYAEHPDFPPRPEVAPTEPIPIVTRDHLRIGDPTRHFRLVQWGFVPGWVKDFGAMPLIIHARAEGIVEKPSFRAAMIRRRCLMIADAFFAVHRPEPRRPGTPYLIRRTDRAPMGFAGLWETWLGADGSEIDTGCLITTAASAAVVAIVPRMPAIISRPDLEAWLDIDGVAADRAAALLRPAPEDALEIVAATRNGPARPCPPPPQAPARQGTLF